MENRSDPARPLPEDPQPTFVRPPGLEFTMGLALFALIFMMFFLVQSFVFFIGVKQSLPQFANEPYSAGMFEDPQFQQQMQVLIFNGDLVAREALWSGGIGLVLIFVSVFIWKKRNAAIFLGMTPPRGILFLKWIGIFLLIGAVIEVIGRSSDLFQSEFMAQVIGSATDRILLFIGIAIMAPLFEEFLLRGLLFGSVRYIADEHVTVAVTAGVFTLMHMQYNWAIMLLILPMGVIFGYARSRTGSIWVPVFLHILNNSASLLIPVE